MAKFFSQQDIRGLLVFLPLAALGVAALMLAKPKNNPDEALQVEARIDTCAHERTGYHTIEPQERTLRLHAFDPNTVDYEEMLEMGFLQKEALSLLRYRRNGKVFRMPEEVDACYGIDHSVYLQLRPYIKISPRYAYQPDRYTHKRTARNRNTIPPTPFRIDTVSARYLQSITGLTPRQAAAIIRWRDLSGIRDMEEFRACYTINDSLATVLEPYILFPETAPHPIDRPIELNRADSAELRRVVGIGEKTVEAILDYRERLGGFVRVEQLAEVQGVTESNYEKILKQIYCDSCEIRKIDINFADPKEWVGHPYIGPEALRKLTNIRKLKGGWSTAEELIEDKIFTKKEAMKLAPYLVFRQESGSDDE